LKRIALVLCAALALGSGAVAGAQGKDAATQPAAGNAVGTAASVDETTLSLGEAAAPARAANNAAGTNTLAYFIRMIFVLALVLGAIYGVYRLMRRLAKPKPAEDSALKILASTSLGPGKALHVVGLGSKAYLIGAADSSISLVAELDDKEFIDALALEATLAPKASRAGGADFGEVLRGLLGPRHGGSRAGGRKSALRQPRGDGDYLAGQRERLRKF
jgi:flagellar protein FliO/FliZ